MTLQQILWTQIQDEDLLRLDTYRSKEDGKFKLIIDGTTARREKWLRWRRKDRPVFVVVGRTAAANILTFSRKREKQDIAKDLHTYLYVKLRKDLREKNVEV